MNIHFLLYHKICIDKRIYKYYNFLSSLRKKKLVDQFKNPLLKKKIIVKDKNNCYKIIYNFQNQILKNYLITSKDIHQDYISAC